MGEGGGVSLVLKYVFLCQYFRANYMSGPAPIFAHLFFICIPRHRSSPHLFWSISLYRVSFFSNHPSDVVEAAALCDVHCDFSLAGAMGEPKHALHRNGIRLRGAHRQRE